MEYSETNFVKDYRPGSDALVELKNGRFLDVINGRFFDSDMSLLVQGGKIKAMPGLAGSAVETAPAFTIDLKGKTVLPGLFNTHCHINMVLPSLLSDFRTMRLSKKYHDQQISKNMAECLTHGVTNIRDAYTDDLRPNRNLKEKISKGEIPGPRILQAVVVGPIGGYLSQKAGIAMRILRAALGMPIIDYDKEESGVVVFPVDANEKQVREAVDKALEQRGADLIKVGEQLENMRNFKPDATIMSFDQLQAITDQAGSKGVKSTIHSVSVDTFRRGVKAGISSLAHMPRDGNLTQEDIDSYLASDCILEPTFSVGYDVSWKIKGDPFYDDPNMNKITEFRDKTIAAVADEYWIPVLRNGVIEGYEKVKRGKLKMMGIIDMSKTYRYYSSIIRYGAENSKMLLEQGATIACGNDAGVPPCTPGMVAHELTIFDLFMNDESGVKNFSAADAVRMATINSAGSMGLEEEFGSIETGKTADLAIVDGDPLEDFHVVGSRVASLFMDGRMVINNCGLEVEPVGKA